jgi:PAS domain S-box-containing protein
MNSEQNNPEVSGSVKKSNETDPPVKPAPEPVEELERRLVEKTRELNEIEARFATFMSYLPAAAFIKDTSGRTLYANKFLQTLLNFQNWEGKTSPELVSGESGQRMLEDDRKALAEGPIRIQETMTVADGRRRNFETIKFPIPVQGKSMLLGGIAIDVTERKRAEEALSEQLDFNQRVFNSTDAHLVVVGADGTILDINAAWRRFAKENQGMDESKWGLGHVLE